VRAGIDFREGEKSIIPSPVRDERGRVRVICAKIEQTHRPPPDKSRGYQTASRERDLKPDSSGAVQ
jgi:hypothetical protein